MNENGDGEVDENFWAQAAAGQAGRGDEGDDSMSKNVTFNEAKLIYSFSHGWRRRSV